MRVSVKKKLPDFFDDDINEETLKLLMSVSTAKSSKNTKMCLIELVVCEALKEV
jgi:hypothetical protein